MEKIIIKGAKSHNLKNINLEIPRNKLVVISGVSGSGKSTLAFDTLYAEGQRRYVESLSSYARQFLGIMEKPDVDSIEGLSPAISIEQKTTSKNPRSTVGTTTEIYDYLRLLFARIGRLHCPKCKQSLLPQTPEMITEHLMKFRGHKIKIFSPVVRQKKGTYEKLFQDLNKDGFSSVLVDGNEYFTDDTIELNKNKKHDILVVVDEFKVDNRHHLSDSIQTALNISKGFVLIASNEVNVNGDKVPTTYSGLKYEKLYTSHSACPKCEIFVENLNPRNFSFNSPFGACSTCTGLGVRYTFDENLIVPDPSISIADGAIKGFERGFEGYRIQSIGYVAKLFGFSIFEPFQSLTKQQQEIVFYGAQKGKEFLDKVNKNNQAYAKAHDFEGVIPMFDRLYQTTTSESRRHDLENLMRTQICESCQGRRLKPEALSVLIDNHNIIDITDLSISNSIKFFEKIKLTSTEKEIANLILKEIKNRLGFLDSVGLGYLTLSRSMDTLSGGESQRIRLASQIGSNLMGVMYVLDEPSLGLHQRDNAKLINTLKHLRDLGNSVIVVEHDEDTIDAADFIVDVGPGAGVNGGNIVASGTPKEIKENPKSLTGKYLSGKLTIDFGKKRREPTGYIKILGAAENNLKNINVEIPTGVLVCITGVSGSGKSTLINDILAKALSNEFFGTKELPGKYSEIIHHLKNLINVDQSPIGRTPRSNPATYTKIFDHIRQLFATTKDAKIRGYKEGRFSFNVKGGRCENCMGDGTIKIEMNFLPDVYVKCDVCKGSRYNQETLEVLYKGHNINQVLSMTVDEAYKFFQNAPAPSLARKLETLVDVGLGYISLGQSAITLSGGEAQRIKLSKELSKISTKETLYILDEPTSGLHFDDVNKLLKVLKRLLDKGASVIVIEHNLDVIKNADYIIDLGPEGGDGGGQIVATGTPEDIAKNAKSYTGKFLKKVLK